MSIQTIEKYITEELPNVTKLESMGYLFFFYDNDQVIPLQPLVMPTMIMTKYLT